jgi:hypothetical protein
MYPGFEYMTALRLTQVIQGLIDIRDINAGLLWVPRTPITPAADGEIRGRFIGNVLIADLIAEDSAGAVYSAGKLQFETYTQPKLKIGKSLTESQLSQLDQIRRGEIRGEETFLNFIGPIATNCLAGIRQRMEFLIVGMLTDTIVYDRLGFKVTGASWGMPADLKVTTANPWDNTATGTPVSDVLAMDLIGAVRYGITFNRMTMSTQAFRYMIATTEFQAKAKVFIPPQLTFANLNLADLQQMKVLAENRSARRSSCTTRAISSRTPPATTPRRPTWRSTRSSSITRPTTRTRWSATSPTASPRRPSSSACPTRP